MKTISLAIVGTAALLVSAQTPSDHGHHDMDQRGNQGMGFDQDKTTHHFLLHKDGGAIQVTANSADDNSSVEHIRMHLGHIRAAFESGDFNIPGFVHNQTPSGVPELIKFKNQIKYSYEKIANGGRITVSSSNHKAVEAIHSFCASRSRNIKQETP